MKSENCSSIDEILLTTIQAGQPILVVFKGRDFKVVSIQCLENSFERNDKPFAPSKTTTERPAATHLK